MTEDMAHSYRLSDDLLKTVAGGSGRVYPYEGRAMAAELIELRRSAAEAAKAARAASIPPVSQPIPFP